MKYEVFRIKPTTTNPMLKSDMDGVPISTGNFIEVEGDDAGEQAANQVAELQANDPDGYHYGVVLV